VENVYADAVVARESWGASFFSTRAVSSILSRCHVLVELQDFVVRGLNGGIRDRFANTH
jgi:hypothetical protein